MQREIRTLWWLGQGTLLFLILVANGFFIFGYISIGVHVWGSFYSQFIQEADE